MAISNLLLKIGKYSMMTFGSIVAVVSLGLGVYGTIYSQQNKDFITTNVSKVNDVVTSVNDNIGELQELSSSTFQTVEDFKQQAISAINTATEQIKQQSSQIDTVIAELEKYKEQINQSSTSYPGLESILGNGDIIAEIDKLIENLKTSKEQILTLVDNLSTQITNISNAVNVQEIQGYVNTAVDLANKYLGYANTIFGNITPSNVDKYYNLTSKILLGVGATLVGLIVVGSLLSFLFYKKVDGKLVSRSKAKKELENHLRKILRKNPDILEQLKRG